MAAVDKSKFQFVEADSTVSERIDMPSSSYWRTVGRQFLKRKTVYFWLFLLMAIVLMSFIYPIFSNYDPTSVEHINDFSMRNLRPSLSYWFGTDANGQSLFDSVWYGSRYSILIAVIVTAINIVAGLLIGGIWGLSKTLDRLMIEVYNIAASVPPLLIIVTLSYAIGPGFWHLILVLCVTGWFNTAYFIRVQILRYRDWEYNLASRTLGTSMFKIMVRNILPQLVSVIVTSASQMLPAFISYEALLSYFGLGLPLTEPSLGRLISNYSSHLTANAYLFWIPLTVLVLVSASLFFVGQHLADASTPHSYR